MNQDEAMRETMDEIERQHGGDLAVKGKQEIRTVIDKLEKEIQTAEEEAKIGTNRGTAAYAGITPEQANLQKKKIVFLKKDLENMQNEYDSKD